MTYDFREIVNRKAFQHQGATQRTLRMGRLPRYPSGLLGVEEKAGGFYGLTVLAAGPKAGKSLIGLRSCLDSAASPGFKVIHVDFELDDLTFTDRLCKAYNVYSLEELPEMVPYLAERMVFIEGRSSQVDEISRAIADGICNTTDEQVLICIDSVSRMAKRMEGAGRMSFFKAQQAITDWARNCVTLTAGKIGVILIFETNRQGQVKGQDPEYTGDCVVTIKTPDPEEPSIQELFLVSRSTPGGNLGRYQLNHDQLKMIYLGESE